KSIKYVYVPNYYLIRLHPKDYQGFVPYQNALLGELREYLTKKVMERQLHLMGQLEIHLDHDIQIPLRQVKVFGKLQETKDFVGRYRQDLAHPDKDWNEGNTLVYEGEIEKVNSCKFNQQWSLSVKEGVDTGESYTLREGRNLIGRQPEAEVNLTDPSVSRYHAQLEVAATQILLTDLGSTNGTCYEGETITTALLFPGSEFGVGNTVLVLGKQEND
ncbi:MAG: FhaA domain-containing protein, partial [Bacillota bacterium]